MSAILDTPLSGTSFANLSCVNFIQVKKLVADTFTGWVDDKAPKLAAALAYYTVFSLTPLLLVAIAIAGLVFKGDAARDQIVAQLGGLVGNEAAGAIQSMIASAGQSGHGIGAAIIGIVTIFFGASGVFGELQDSINTIWKVDAKKHSGIKALIKDRFVSFTMVLGVGFLLTVSLILSAIVGAVTKYFGGGFFWEALNFLVSFGVVSLLFSLIFKIVPDVKLRWQDTWIGGIFTAFLFTIGKTLLGLYLGRASVTSGFGAAGSLIIILLWVYYTAQILFIGVEFTRVYATTVGSKINSKHGIKTTPTWETSPS